MHRKTAGYVARAAPNELIFIGFCRERRGEADSGLRLDFAFFLHYAKEMKSEYSFPKNSFENCIFLAKHINTLKLLLYLRNSKYVLSIHNVNNLTLLNVINVNIIASLSIFP